MGNTRGKHTKVTPSSSNTYHNVKKGLIIANVEDAVGRKGSSSSSPVHNENIQRGISTSDAGENSEIDELMEIRKKHGAGSDEYKKHLESQGLSKYVLSTPVPASPPRLCFLKKEEPVV